MPRDHPSLVHSHHGNCSTDMDDYCQEDGSNNNNNINNINNIGSNQRKSVGLLSKETNHAEVYQPWEATTETALVSCHDSSDCDAVLETIDNCVGCVEGIDMQHQFEEVLKQRSLRHQKIAAAHGLSEAEAAMIRRQISSQAVAPETGISKLIGSTMTMWGYEDLHLDHNSGCGGLAMAGLISPTDTTTPCTDDGFLETDRRSCSLMDLAVPEDPVRVGEPLELQCAICFDKAGMGDLGEDVMGGSSALPSHSHSHIRFVHFPCCGTASAAHVGIGEDDESSYQEASSNHPRGVGGGMPAINVCMSCILVLTMVTADGLSRVGRCPCCRTWIAASTVHSPQADSLTIRTLDGSVGQCQTCLQDNETLVEQDPPTCDACFLGQRAPLLYECQDCHQVQAIPHPMYRYQSSADSFGSATRACRAIDPGSCNGNSTHWRICKSQLQLIPAGDVPVGWGEDYLSLARVKVQSARRGISKLEVSTKKLVVPREGDEGCTIL
jgi:hypothetical protein